MYVCVCVCVYIYVYIYVLAALNEDNLTLLSGVRFLVVDEINHLSQRACLVVEYLSLVVEYLRFLVVDEINHLRQRACLVV